MKTLGKNKPITPLLFNLCTRCMWGRKLHAQFHLRLAKNCCALGPTAALDVSEIEKNILLLQEIVPRTLQAVL